MKNNIIKSKATFWLLRSHPNNDDEVPVRMQITMGDKRLHMSTGIWVDENHFDVKRQVVKNRDVDADAKNEKLKSLLKSYNDAYIYLLRTETSFPITAIKDVMEGKNISVKSLIELMKFHNAELKKVLGKGCSQLKYNRFRLLEDAMKKFLNEKQHQTDIALSKLSVPFLNNFFNYVKNEKGEKGVSNNTAVKYCKRLKQVTKFALMNQFLERDPFMGFRARMEPTKMPFLTPDELKKVEEKEMPIERLENVRRIFLMQCYTGLAYVDIKKLNENDIMDIKGQKWLFTQRTKVKIDVRVPLMDKAIHLLNAGFEHLQIPTNQRMNSYLKEIADICGIKKNLTTHVARRTFATVCLTNGVSMESVSRMLGHTNIQTTQIYAKIIPEKILREMQQMQERMIEKNKE